MSERKPVLEIEIRGLSKLDQAVQSLLDHLGDQRKITFSGEIGAGKTTLIQAFCRHLGVQEPVTSPTFSLVNEYTYLDKEGDLQVVYHMDLYRLKQMEEALAFGIEEYLDSEYYCLIEWPEIIDELLSEDTARINIEIVENSTRKIVIL
jgi:tRNA threonylcarbamoyladenosine biosynthesis protein TsaE